MFYEAKVRFGNSSMWYVYITTISDLKKGEHVLVDSSNGLGVAKFIEYTTGTPKSRLYSWILDRINLHKLREEIAEMKEIRKYES